MKIVLLLVVALVAATAAPAAAGVDTTACLTIAETSLSARFGESVSGAGDVNGDGFADVVVGASEFSNGQTDEGRASLYLGGPAGLGTFPAWMDEINQAAAWFGFSVSGAGDVNGDGFADVIVGGPQFDNPDADEGTARLYYGSPSGITNPAGWVIEGGAAGARLGHSVSTAGDVNGDGYADVIVGLPGYAGGQTGEGRALVFYGSASGLSTSPSWAAESNDAGAEFGHAVACAGDVNGDGYDDVIIGAQWYSSFPGQAYVYHGGPSGLAATPARILSSLDSGSRFGFSVASAGDVNNDGYDDVIVGARLVSEGEGTEGGAYLYLGGPTGVAAAHSWYVEGNRVGANLGYDVAGAGDLDADGYDDVLVGGPYLDPGGDGAVRIFFGGATGLALTPAITLYSPDVNAQFGWSVAGVGDFDGDFDADLVIGAPVRGGYKGSIYAYCGTSEAICDVQPSSLDFGTVAVGASFDLSFTIENTGSGTLGGAVTEACGDFTIVSGGGAFSLGAGQTRTVTVRFQPVASGTSACAIETGQTRCGDVSVSGVGASQSPVPVITAITDIGNDQGRQVRIAFAKSPRDTTPSATPILHYEAFRRIDPLSSLAPPSGVARMPGPAPITESPVGPAISLAGWDFLGTIPAHGESEYLFVVPTLADSTVADGMHWSIFFLRAATSNPMVFFDSAPDSGYSLDNLVPAAPTGLAWAGALLVWNDSPEADFDYFTVYGSASPTWDGSAVRWGATVDAQMAPGPYAYHHVTATDFSGNEGPAATIGQALDAANAARPARFALAQNAPNPFREATGIHFDLPEPVRVELAIFDTGGRRVRALARAAYPAGRHTVGWDGRDDAGHLTPAGIYYVRLIAGVDRGTRRMLRLR